MIDVYIVLIRTRQQDLRVGAIYTSREDAEAECARLEKAQGKLEVNSAYHVCRKLEVE